MIKDLKADIDLHTNKLISTLRRLQNEDGGFKGYYCHDSTSGVWATAEIVHNV